MAGIAGNFSVALEVVFIDRHHHIDHLPRGDFGLFVVLFVRVRHMAELAFDAKRSGNELHRGDHLIGRDSLESLNILELFLRELRPRRGRRRIWCTGLCPGPGNRQQEAQRRSADGKPEFLTILMHRINPRG